MHEDEEDDALGDPCRFYIVLVSVHSLLEVNLLFDSEHLTLEFVTNGVRVSIFSIDVDDFHCFETLTSLDMPLGSLVFNHSQGHDECDQSGETTSRHNYPI